MFNNLFNLEAVTRDRFTRLAMEGNFLVTPKGGKGKTFQEWRTIPLRKRRIGVSEIAPVIFYHAGDVSIKVQRGHAVFLLNGEIKWTVDVLHFAGSPRLRVRQEGETIRLQLSDASFPGTDIPADFEAVISRDADVWYMNLAFTWGGFQSRVALVPWLLWQIGAGSSLLRTERICSLDEAGGIVLNGEPAASFFPCWMFIVKGVAAATIRTRDREITADLFAFSLLEPGMQGILSDPPLRRTLLCLGNPYSPPWFSLNPTGNSASDWNVAASAPCFSAIQVEAGERLNGQVYRLTAALSSYQPPSGKADQIPFLHFRPGADLLAGDGSPFALTLFRPLYLALYNGDGTRAGDALLGQLAQRAYWLHTRAVSLHLGLPAGPLFLLVRLESVTDGLPLSLQPGTYCGHPLPMQQGNFGLRFPLLATVARPGADMVANPAPVPPGTIAVLSLSTPKPSAMPDAAMVRLEGLPTARIIFPASWWSILLRHRDLLVLFIRFDNLQLESRGDDPPELLRVGTSPGTVVVHFPPQSVGEDTTWESAAGSDPAPLLVDARVSGLSRLAFTVADSPVPFTMHTLLNWVVEPGNLYRKLLKARLVPTGEAPRQPGADETAIEAPLRLFLSPDQNGSWRGSRQAVMAGDRAELWHVRLSQGQATPAKVRAVWVADMESELSPQPKLTLDRQDRIQIVDQSIAKPVDSRRLMLTSLGAWLDLDGQWDAQLESWRHIATMGRDHYVRVVHRGYLLPFGHKAVYVEVCERKLHGRLLGFKEGLLFKRAFIVVREPERIFSVPDETSVFAKGDFRRRMPFARVRMMTGTTPLLDDPADSTILGSEEAFWPRVRDAAGVVRDVLFHLVAEDRDGRPVEFSTPMAFVRARRNGPDDPDSDPEKVNPGPYRTFISNLLGKIYEHLDIILASGGPALRYIIPLSGQSVAFAEDRLGGNSASADVAKMAFKAEQNQHPDDPDPDRPCVPVMVEARVVLPALRHLGGLQLPQRVTYAKQFLTGGFSPSGNAGEVFLRLLQGVDLNFGADNPPDKVGGVLAPNMKVCGVSRSLGAVGAKPASGTDVADTNLDGIAGGSFEPAVYFGGALEAKLLGGISLAQILGSASGLAEAPRWVSRQEADGMVYQLVWTTSNLKSNGIFEPGNGTKLTLRARTLVKAEGGAQSTITGTVNNFTITLAGVIGITFEEFTFEVVPGRKPLVHLRLNPDSGVAFAGALQFLSKIEKQLHLDQFSDPPSVDVSGSGVTVGYSIGIPSIAVGAFALQNLALSAGLTLPFTGEPIRARFALSERHNPFLITVSLFAGGGFLALGVGPDGVECLEASLEFGGNFSLNLGVASGGVYVMAGIYFKYENDAATLCGYLRAGGALEVLALICVNVEFYLAFTYQQTPSMVWGEASMTVKVEVLFFSKSVTLTVRREFAGGSRDIPFEEMMSKKDWKLYQTAFATEV
jgi:hypothetical protein